MGDEELMGDNGRSVRSPDAYDERKYRLTEKGKERVETLLAENEYKPVIDGIKKIRSKFGGYSLDDLLYYVYTKYPEMTTESEIKEKVLRRRHRI
jgi:DNA-binding PadR family transcriptional regulator